MSEEDPLSTHNIGVHLLKLIVFLVGGCAIEAIKHKWKPPFFTTAILNIGELTMFIYMTGALGQAFHWSWNQWSRGQPIFAEGGKSLLKQFLPKQLNLRSALQPPRFLSRLVIIIIAFLLTLFVFEILQTMSGTSLSKYNFGRVFNLERTGVLQQTPHLLYTIVVSGFNLLSPWVLVGAIGLGAVAILCFVLVIPYNRRRRLMY